MIFERLDRLLDLEGERLAVLLQQAEQLRVVHLEEHPGDLGSELWVGLLDDREETLAEHLLLLRLGVLHEE